MTNNSESGGPATAALALAIDVGTTSLKAAFVSAAGEVFSFKRIEYSKNCAANQEALQDRNCAAAWAAALRECFPSQFAGRCAAVSVSGNGPTIVAADGTTLPWGAQVDCKTAIEDGLFAKIDIPDEQKKIYAPRLAAFKEKFPDAWNQDQRLYTSSSWLCDWIKKNAADFGLAPDVPVFDAGPDFLAALVGTATLFPGRLCDRAGSSEGLNLCSPKFFSPKM